MGKRDSATEKKRRNDRALELMGTIPVNRCPKCRSKWWPCKCGHPRVSK
jgi:hypothetical protein